MNPENTHPLSPHLEKPERRVIEYPKLTNAVQLSVARLLDMHKSFETDVFEEVLFQYPEKQREDVIEQVGERFDDALIQLVVGSLIGRNHHTTIILAEKTEGIAGHLPWEPKLGSHVETLKNGGLLRNVHVSVERYSNGSTAIMSLANYTHLSQEAQPQQKHAA